MCICKNTRKEMSIDHIELKRQISVYLPPNLNDSKCSLSILIKSHKIFLKRESCTFYKYKHSKRV